MARNTFTNTYGVLCPASPCMELAAINKCNSCSVLANIPTLAKRIDKLSPVTEPLFACQWTTGVEGQQWKRLDAVYNETTGKYIYTESADQGGGLNYLQNNPVYSRIEEVVIDGNYFIKIPKVYVRREMLDSTNSPYEWGDMRAVSASMFPGSEVHPAFFHNGQELDYILIGKYLSVLSENDPTKLTSTLGTPLINVSANTLKEYCENNGNNYHMINIHELSLIQLLILIEYCNTNVQEKISMGRASVTDEGGANWRGFVDLWGNLKQAIEGLTTEKGLVPVNGKNVNTLLKIFDKNTNLVPVLGYPSYPYHGTRFYPNRLFYAENAKYIFVTCDFTKDYGTGTGKMPPYYNVDINNAAYPDEQELQRTTNYHLVMYHGGKFSKGNISGLFYTDLLYSYDEVDDDVTTRLAKYPD